MGILAAQSSLFQALDIIFNVSHHGPKADYLRNARVYILLPYRQFLDYLQADFSGTLKGFVSYLPDLADSYNRYI